LGDPESQYGRRGEKSHHLTKIKIKKRGNVYVIIDVLRVHVMGRIQGGMTEERYFEKNMCI
jgi:hypothetical protein